MSEITMTEITIVRPEGETDYLCRVPAEIVEQLSDWREVGYARMKPIGENAVELQFSTDLERITDPNGDD